MAQNFKLKDESEKKIDLYDENIDDLFKTNA